MSSVALGALLVILLRHRRGGLGWGIIRAGWRFTGTAEFAEPFFHDSLHLFGGHVNLNGDYRRFLRRRVGGDVANEGQYGEKHAEDRHHATWGANKSSKLGEHRCTLLHLARDPVS